MPQQKQYKILLIGDSCTDEYVYGTCERLNPEAPVPILKFNRKETTKGMAWNVRENLMSFGLSVYILTNKEPITKTRYIDEKSNQQILRVDDECSCEPMEYEQPFHKRSTTDPPSDDWYDALVISDYDKGFLTTKRIFELVEWFLQVAFQPRYLLIQMLVNGTTQQVHHLPCILVWLLPFQRMYDSAFYFQRGMKSYQYTHIDE